MPRWGTRRRWKMKKINLQKRQLIFISFVIFLGMMVQSFFYIEGQLQPILISIAEARVKQIATNALNDAISKKIAQNTSFNDLIQFETDNQGKIRAALFNYGEFARVVGEATARVEDTLNDLEKMEEKIKLGAAFNSKIFANAGPEIPITLVPIGHAEVTPDTNFQNAGINVVVMTVVINIKAEVQVVIPFVTKATSIATSVPIAQTQIFGEVPQFYYDGSNYNSTDPSKSTTPPPIQIIPGTPSIPNNTQPNVGEAAPSSSPAAEPIPGFESFYPIISGKGVPFTGVAQ